MDTLHSILRHIREGSKPRRDHLEVFRDFLEHLDRAGRRTEKRAKAKKRIRRKPAAR